MKRRFSIMKKTWHPQEVTLTSMTNSISIVNNDFNYSIEDILSLGLNVLKEMVHMEKEVNENG